MSREVKILGSIAIVIVAILGVLFLKAPQPSSNSVSASPSGSSIFTATPDMSALVRSDSHGTGSKTAKVSMVEFGDYQCPACGAVYPDVKQMTDAYKDKDFNFIFRNFPLPQHPNAPIAAEAAEAAGAQGKYWEMHDILYEHQTAWSDSTDPLPTFISYAIQLGLNVDQFKQDVSQNKYASVIEADKKDAGRLNLDHTPTIFINGNEIDDVSAQNLSSVIDGLLVQ